MSKSGKFYAKALKYYNKGNIEKAADLCDKSMAIDMHAPSMNLRGLIYYLKGELDNAIRIWRMNNSANNDSVSRKYIKDAQSDKKRMELFKQAVKFYDDVNISKAMELLRACSESDFNCIDVNNYLTSCCIKMGDYAGALMYMEKVISFDSENVIARNNQKIIREFGGIEQKRSGGFIPYIAVILAVTVLAVVFYRFVPKSYGQLKGLQDKNKNYEASLKTGADLQNADKASVKSSEKPAESGANEISVFPAADFQKSMENGDFDSLYEEVSAWKDKKLNIDDSILLKKAVNLIKEKGVKDFYIKGCNFLSNGDYASAAKYLTKAYEYGKDNYLYQSLLYTLAECMEKSSNAAMALKYYEEYDALYYPKGEYESTVLYNMTMLYRDVDAKKAQEYAGKLLKAFPDSIYNNENVKKIAE